MMISRHTQHIHTFLQYSVFRGEHNIYLPRGMLTRINVFNYFQKRQVHFSFKTSEFFYGVFLFYFRYYYYYSSIYIFFLRLLFSLCKSPKGLSFRCHLSNIFRGRFFDIFFFIYLFFFVDDFFFSYT
jgi:hypothetical protein